MAFMDTASSWVSKFLGVENTADSPALLDPDAPTAPDIDDILNGYKEDLTRQNLITLGRDFSPDEIKNMRHRARYGDPRFMYAFFDEMLRLGPGTQKQISIEAMKAAMPQFVTSPEDWDDDSNVPLDADPVDVANARAARDYLQDTLTPHLADLIQIHGNVHFYGIADSKIVLNPRGNSGQWDAIADISEVPARRHRLDVVTHEWMLMPSPDSWEGVPISQLLLQPDRAPRGWSSLRSVLGQGTSISAASCSAASFRGASNNTLSAGARNTSNSSASRRGMRWSTSPTPTALQRRPRA